MIRAKYSCALVFISNGLVLLALITLLLNYSTCIAENFRRDFDWIFRAKGISLVSPAIDPVDGTVYVPTTDIDIGRNLIDLLNQDQDSGFIDFRSSLYALDPNPIAHRGKKKWLFDDIEGVIIFPPVISDDRTIFVVSVDKSIIVNDLSINLQGKLFAIDNDGKEKWAGPVTFNDGLFLAPPVIGPDGAIYTITAKSSNLFDIHAENLNSIITALDPLDGQIKWRFNPSELNNSKLLFSIAPPAIAPNSDTIIVNAINSISEEEIEDFISTNKELQEGISALIIENIQDLITDVDNLKDIGSVLNDIEDDMEMILVDFLNANIDKLFSNLGIIIGLDLNGIPKWQSTLPALSLAAPVITNSGIINIGGTSILSNNVSSDVKLEINLTLDGAVPEISIDFDIFADGITFSGEMEIEIDPENLSEALISSIDITGIGVSDPGSAFDGVFIGLNASDGELLWSTNIDEPIFFRPIITDDEDLSIVGVCDFDILSSKIYGISTTDGSIKWESNSFDGANWTPPLDFIFGSPLLISGDGSIFFSLIDTDDIDVENPEVYKIHSLRSEDGALKWEKPFISDGFSISAPVINRKDDTIFLGTLNIQDLTKEAVSNVIRRLIRELTKNTIGNIIEKLTGGPGMRGPVIEPGIILDLINLIPESIVELTKDLKGELIKLDADDGTIKESLKIDGLPISSPAISANRVFIATSNLRAIGRKKTRSINLLSLVHAVNLD